MINLVVLVIKRYFPCRHYLSVLLWRMGDFYLLSSTAYLGGDNRGFGFFRYTIHRGIGIIGRVGIIKENENILKELLFSSKSN